MLLLDSMEKTLNDFKTLVQIIEKLRGPDGCPWDKEQTQKSLTQYILEEAFELVEAIEGQNQKEICDELGDCLLQVVLQAQIAKDEGHFKIEDVIENLSEKMIRRHPHVFGETKAKNSEEVWRNWHTLKNQENQKKQKPLFSYPQNLPALQAAHKIGRKTEGFRFDWPNAYEVFKKVQEEVDETQEALQSKNKQELEHEIGDLLFSVAQLARHVQLDPEACLREANRRFEKRFTKVLELSRKDQAEFQKLTPEEMNELWEEAKKAEA